MCAFNLHFSFIVENIGLFYCSRKCLLQFGKYSGSYKPDLSVCSFSAGLSGSCLWSCSPLWFGSGMDSPCQPPQTLNTAKSCRNGSNSSGPSARRWPVSKTGGRLRAGSLIYSKILWNHAFFCACTEEDYPFKYLAGIYIILYMTLFTQHLFSSHLFSFASSEGVSYMSVCHCSLPVAKAFCFLEDLRWEFTACFNNAAIALADRPYLFLEFGKQEKICSQFCLFYFISTVYVICFFLLSFKDILYSFFAFDRVINIQIGPFKSWSSSTTRAVVLPWRWHL